tara:strand:- start:806 stop:1114 length:309 start_codon:yes stop_codon:yes gene_type:complete
MKKLILLLSVLFIVSCSEDTPLPLENTHTLITSVSPPEGGSISPATGEHNEWVSLDVTATPSNGYIFVGWTWGGIVTENTLYPSTIVIMDKDYEVTANFEIQ